MLQQYLPFTVLKRFNVDNLSYCLLLVATVLTVYGIETLSKEINLRPSPFMVATVLTVYGIETIGQVGCNSYSYSCNSTYRLRY